MYRRMKRPPVIALDKLVLNLAASASTMHVKDLATLAEQLTMMRDEEAELRDKSARDGVSYNVRMVSFFLRAPVRQGEA